MPLKLQLPSLPPVLSVALHALSVSARSPAPVCLSLPPGDALGSCLVPLTYGPFPPVELSPPAVSHLAVYSILRDDRVHMESR